MSTSSATETPMAIVVDPPAPPAPMRYQATTAPAAFPASDFTFPALPLLAVPYVRRRPVEDLMERASTPAPMLSSPTILPVTPAAGGSGMLTAPEPGVMSSVPSQAFSCSALGSQPQAEPHTSSPASLAPRSNASPVPSQELDQLESGLARAAIPHSSSPSHTGSNGTPPPDAASGRIQGLNTYEVFEVVRPETLREWEAVSGPKVIIFIANDTVTNEVHHRVTLIRKALITIFPNINPMIGSAAVSDAADVTHQPVFPFLIHDISELYARRLILQHCWTINGFSFFALNFTIPVTTYAMTLVGLHLPAKPESDNVVAALVHRWLCNSPSVNSFIRDHHDNLPKFMSVDEQIEFAFGTVEASHMKLGGDDDSAVAFNAYIYPPTSDPLLHQSWLQAVRTIIYYANCGTGKAMSIFCCNICKGRDHSSSACPFPVSRLFKIDAGVQGPTVPTADSTCHKSPVGERSLSAGGINFNYFIHSK